MKPHLGSWLVLVIVCLAHGAHADAPRLVGGGGIGVRTSSTSTPRYDTVFDETSSIRFAAQGGVGARFGRFIVGAHAGIATPLRYSSGPLADSGEQVAWTESTIYPLDLGVSAQVEVTSRFWLSAWFGGTIAFSFATSPATHINAIDYFGDIPAASWSDQTASLGGGGGLGYDVSVNEYGRFAITVDVESQGVGRIPVRENTGETGSEPEAVRSTSFTLGAAYRY